MEELATKLLDTPVTGLNLAGTTLGDQLAPGRTIVAFLRHFG